MNKFLISAAALALMSGSAMAQSTPATGTVNVTATIQATCTIATLAAVTVTALDFSNTTATPSATISTAPQTANFGTADCNTPTHIKLDSANGGSSTSTANSSTAFQTFFDYKSDVSWGGASVSLTTAGPSGVKTATSSGVTTGPNSAALSVVVTPQSPSKPLVVGNYTDTLTVTLTAN